MARLLDYTPELRAKVQAELDGLLAGLEHAELVRPQLEISLPWNLRVSPAHASLTDIAAATLDIALWVFTLDDYVHEDYDDFFAACLATLTGAEPDPARPILSVFARHRQHLHDRNRPMTRYLDSRRDIADAYRRRNRLARGLVTVDFQQYLEWRRVLIGTRVWLSAWEVLGDFWLPDEVHESPAIRDALDSLIYGQILENEIHSLPRDLAAGTPNLVVMYANEQGLTIDESTKQLLERFRRNEATVRATTARAAEQFAGDARVAALLEMIELCLEGSASLYKLDLSRYRAPTE